MIKKIFLLLFFSFVFQEGFCQQNIQENNLSFNDDLSSYTIDLKKFSPEGNIYLKKYNDKTGYEIIESEPNSPGLRIVWPTLDLLNTKSQMMRISGSTSAGAEVLINGKKETVFQTGAFTTLLKLNPGKNDVIITAQKNGKLSSTILPINYELPRGLITSPEFPLTIDDNFTNKPDKIFLTYPEKIKIFMKGSPKKNAFFQIGEKGNKIPMVEKDPGEEDNTWRIRGIYGATFQPSKTDSITSQPLIFYLSNPLDSSKIVSLKTNIFISVNPESKPLMIEIVAKDGFARIQSKKEGGTFYRLPNGLKFIAARIESGFVKIKTDNKKEYWMRLEDLKIFEPITDISSVLLKSPQYISSLGKLESINFPIFEALPYYTYISDEKPELLVNWFGNKINYSENFPNSQTGALNNFFKIKTISDTFTSNFYSKQISISWAENFNWGFKVGYEDNNFNIKINQSPPLNDDNIFQGLRICIDPGHGGELAGAVGCLGFEEKEANLKISFYLLDLLKNNGADVVMTRSDDIDISLEKRLQIASDFNAHILVSVHNNSVGSGSRAEEIGGSSVFYYNPNSRLLAKKINQKFMDIKIRNRGAKLENFFLTRPHEMICVLTECVFISNPFEERLLISEQFQKEIALKIFEGIKDFLLEIKNRR